MLMCGRESKFRYPRDLLAGGERVPRSRTAGESNLPAVVSIHSERREARFQPRNRVFNDWRERRRAALEFSAAA